MSTSRRHLLSHLLGLAGVAAGLPHAKANALAAPAMLLAKWCEAGTDPAPYLVSEKYDGVRGLWDGHELRFRSGRRIAAPRSFTDRLPVLALDGELWLGRGRFDALAGIVRKLEPIDAEWRALRYLVFETPAAAGTFEQRHAQLQRWVSSTEHPQVQVVEQLRIPDRASLQRRLEQVVAAGGEGLMLHLADAPYVTGRQDVLLKLKPMRDTEARVVGHLPGRGRHQGRLGALELQTPQGLRFSLGSGFSDAQRRDPPPLGSTVSYRYRGLTPGGVPRFASFVALRLD